MPASASTSARKARAWPRIWKKSVVSDSASPTSRGRFAVLDTTLVREESSLQRRPVDRICRVAGQRRRRRHVAECLRALVVRSAVPTHRELECDGSRVREVAEPLEFGEALGEHSLLLVEVSGAADDERGPHRECQAGEQPLAPVADDHSGATHHLAALVDAPSTIARAAPSAASTYAARSGVRARLVEEPLRDLDHLRHGGRPEMQREEFEPLELEGEAGALPAACACDRPFRDAEMRSAARHVASPRWPTRYQYLANPRSSPAASSTAWASSPTVHAWPSETDWSTASATAARARITGSAASSASATSAFAAAISPAASRVYARSTAIPARNGSCAGSRS